MGGLIGGGSTPTIIQQPAPVVQQRAYEPTPPEDKGGPSAAELKAAKDRQKRLAAQQGRDAFRVDLAHGGSGSGLSIRQKDWHKHGG